MQAVNKSLQHRIKFSFSKRIPLKNREELFCPKNFWERGELSPGLLGEKRERYLCAMPTLPPPSPLLHFSVSLNWTTKWFSLKQACWPYWFAKIHLIKPICWLHSPKKFRTCIFFPDFFHRVVKRWRVGVGVDFRRSKKLGFSVRKWFRNRGQTDLGWILWSSTTICNYNTCKKVFEKLC